MNTNKRTGPLSRFRVLDLTRLRSGPTAVRQLADWGSDVIKIESPEALGVSDGWGDSRIGPDFQNLHRNKRSITLNFKEPQGIAILKKLAAKADVVVENFRPDVKHRLGIDYETLRQANPALVYASVSGFGQDGPYAKRPGYDQIIQGMGGLMSVTGIPGQGPVRAGISVVDSVVGLYCALGILTALLEREETGQGKWVETSLLQAMIALLDYQAARWLIAKDVPTQVGNDHPTSVPTGVFPTADGFMNIAGAGAQQMWGRLCKALGAEHLINKPEYETLDRRCENRKALSVELFEYTKKRTTQEWIQILEAASVACGPIYSIDQVFADPQTRHLGMAVPVTHPELGDISFVGQPFTLSGQAAQIDSNSLTPARGQHTDEVMRELGYDDDQIADFKARLII